jgi:hypothetical protein
MGIRYYAYPLRPQDVERAELDPRAFISRDPFRDAWGPDDLRPEMLYLDKCWRELQWLLGARGGGAPRRSLVLVEGEVTETATGWIPYMKVMTPKEVAAVARDLADVGHEEIRAQDWNYPGRGWSADYVWHYLDAARRFVEALAQDGRGLVYLIG